MEKSFGDSLKKNMDKFSSQEALDNQHAYYKDEMKYFINAVYKAAVERHLVHPLPQVILSPLVITEITELTDKQFEFIAAEPHEVTQQRDYLESRKIMLEKGMNTYLLFITQSPCFTILQVALLRSRLNHLHHFPSVAVHVVVYYQKH